MHDRIIICITFDYSSLLLLVIHDYIPAQLDEQNLPDVMKALIPSLDETRYYHFGTSLGLTPSKLRSIQLSNPNNPVRALQEMVTAWLQWKFDFFKIGYPVWQTIVKAVHSPDGGNNYSLAKKIADHHPAIICECMATLYLYIIYTAVHCCIYIVIGDYERGKVSRI